MTTPAAPRCDGRGIDASPVCEGCPACRPCGECRGSGRMPLHSAVFRRSANLGNPTHVWCGYCSGSGVEPDTECGTCGDEGRVPCICHEGGEECDHDGPCPACSPTGEEEAARLAFQKLVTEQGRRERAEAEVERLRTLLHRVSTQPFGGPAGTMDEIRALLCESAPTGAGELGSLRALRDEVERLTAVAEGISKWRHDIVYPTADGPRRFHMHVRWEDCPDPECVASRAALRGEGPQGG